MNDGSKGQGGKRESKKPVPKKQPTLFGLKGFEVSVNKVDKTTRKVVSSFVRKDMSTGSDGVQKPNFLRSRVWGGRPWQRHILPY